MLVMLAFSKVNLFFAFIGVQLSLNSTRVRTLKKKNKVENQKVPTDPAGRLAYHDFFHY